MFALFVARFSLFMRGSFGRRAGLMSAGPGLPIQSAAFYGPIAFYLNEPRLPVLGHSYASEPVARCGVVRREIYKRFILSLSLTLRPGPGRRVKRARGSVGKVGADDFFIRAAPHFYCTTMLTRACADS